MMLAYERAGKWDEVMLCNVSSVAFVCKGVEYLLLGHLDMPLQHHFILYRVATHIN